VHVGEKISLVLSCRLVDLAARCYELNGSLKKIHVQPFILYIFVCGLSQFS
jgi:hypothetical protein